MKKRGMLLKLMAAVMAVGLMVTGCSGGGEKKEESKGAESKTESKAEESKAEEGKSEDKKEGPKFRIGFAVQDITNPTWAGICENAKKAAEEAGGELTYVSCESKIAKQIEQVENFITNKVDLIIIHPADPNGIEDVAKRAMDAGIKVVAWDDNLKNCDAAFVIDNYKLGELIGQEAAKFINEKHGGKCEVAVLNYPQLPILLQRGNGIVDALKKDAPNATIVAEQPAINPTEGQSVMETIFQAHPDVKVVCCIGGGGAVGANEAAKTAGKIDDGFGIFAADATPQELAAIRNHEGCRMSVMITGGPKAMGKEIIRIAEEVLAGKIEHKEIFRELIPVSAENIDKVDTE